MHGTKTFSSLMTIVRWRRRAEGHR